MLSRTAGTLFTAKPYTICNTLACQNLITRQKLQEQPLHKAALGASKTYPAECPEANDTIPVPDSIPAIRTWQWQTIP